MRSLQFMPLRSLAYQQGYTQSELASAAGLAPSTMNARLQGRSTFRAEEMQRLGRLLGIDPAEYCHYFMPTERATGGRA